MGLVIIESPFSGDVENNIQYARKCMLDSIFRGESPFASHLLYTQVLDDNKEDERKLGMYCGFEVMKKADFVAVYNDLGISDGMNEGIKRAKELGLKVEYRSLLDNNEK